MPNSVLNIGGYAFTGINLNSVVVPNTIQTIGNGAFGSNENLRIFCRGNNEECVSLQNKLSNYKYWDSENQQNLPFDLSNEQHFSLVNSEQCYGAYYWDASSNTCNSCGTNRLCHWDDGVVIDGCRNGSILDNGNCYACNSPAINCEVKNDKAIPISCIGGYLLAGGKCVYSEDMKCTSIDDLNYCAKMNGNDCVQYVVDENRKAVAKVSCKNCVRGENKTDCTTEMYDENGNVSAIYGDDGEAPAAYDYDDKGDVIAEYDNQCAVESCSNGYRERDNSCVVECGAGWRDMGSWCNRIQWTPAEAAKVLTNDNNNSVTITFKK